MRRDFAWGFLAGLFIGWVWLRFAPPADNITRLGVEWRQAS